MPPLLPRMMAAPIGPMPYTSVTEVFDAVTPAVVRVRVSASAASREAVWVHVATHSSVMGSPTCPPARSLWLGTRSGTGPCPSMSRRSTACRRHTVRVR
jgi:hypothetical protein